MKSRLIPLVVVISLISLTIMGCSQAAPAAPTQVSAKAAETTKPAEPTKAAVVAQPTAVPAATYPQKGKIITYFVPFGTGGSADIGSRVVAPVIEKTLGTTIEVINKPGASAQIGLTELARAKPDGYTIGAVNTTSFPLVYLDPDRKAAFGRKDLQLIASRAEEPVGWVVKADSQYKTLQDVVDAEKAKPGTVKFGTSSIGAGPHFTLLMFQHMTGLQFDVVPFDNKGQLRASLLGRHLDVEVGTAGDLVPGVKSGDTRGLAVFTTSEYKFMPGVATARAQGFDLVLGAHHGVGAPAGVSQEVVNAWREAIKKALDDPTVRQKYDELGMLPTYLDTATFEKLVADLEVSLKPVIEALKKK